MARNKQITSSPFPILSKTKITELLATETLNNPKTIQTIETILKKMRGYIFKMPPPGSPVVFLYSGGLDTTVVAAILMQEYKLTLYPVFTKRGQAYQWAERQAASFFEAYFNKRYPGQFLPIKEITAYFPPLEIRQAYEDVENKFLDQPKGKNFPRFWGDFFYSSLLVSFAAQYAYTLEITNGVRVRTVFTSFILDDARSKQDQTLTALRSIMLHVCYLTNDFDWQITSLPLEKELGFFHDKDTLIKWAVENKIPIEMTRTSCKNVGKLHCGKCLLCARRKVAFESAGIEDKTIYLNDYGKYNLIRLRDGALTTLFRLYRKLK